MNDPGGLLEFAATKWLSKGKHTVFTSETIHESALLQFHGTVDGVAVLVKLEAVLRRIDEVALVVGPLLEELAGGESSKAIVVLYEVIKRKLFRQDLGSEAGVAADECLG